MEKALSEYMLIAEKLEPKDHSKNIKLAFLSSFTINGLAEVVKTKCHYKKVFCNTYVGSYNQYNQEILNNKSNLYKFNPELTFLILDVRSIFDELYYFPHRFSLEQKNNFISNKVNELINLVTYFKTNSNSKLILSNLPLMSQNSHIISESKTEFNNNQMILQFNKLLEDKIRNLESVFIFNMNDFVIKYGEENVFNYQNYFFGDIKIALNFIPHLGNMLMSFIIAFLGISKKCIVLDLDDTLWGGIVGEDGFDGISLGPQPPGNSFVEFQKYLKAMSERGIILSINSRNNVHDALNVIRNHPYMILKEEDFSCIVINWGDKVENLREISKKLNIGLDSMVFFDDDPVNREYVRNRLPDVQVPEMPSDPSDYCRVLLDMNEFSSYEITEEDLKRKEMYSQQQKRIELQQNSSNLDDFLNTLNLHVILKNADSYSIPRISQLTLKTNQFNLTTKRYQKSEIDAFSKSQNMLVGSAQVLDKFGDSGITGVYIIKKTNSKEWEIDSFLLSCRVMGREIEKVMMEHIINLARKNNVEILKAKFIPTEKNEPIKSFLPACGFIKSGDSWVYDIKQPFTSPTFVKKEIK
ncbi:HAD-IIIC family phosphatase [Nitrosarchaeum sp.]|uniref:HAD-IIIC family phosphatase n=1 Tax=Nitrosarchaeum sp. TaxID=2026886 RepID=UPI00247BF550|nr:HAD-IIIC family phosphatase [Nitrosarchaeum sp.]MCV0411894.1 HAD-IIIC family phosphatase [Nitrosarchaeum sp.]